MINFRTALLGYADGRLDDLVLAAERRTRLLLELGYAENAAILIGMLVSALEETGDVRSIVPVVDLVDATASASRTRLLEAEVARARGVVASHAGWHDEAAERFATSLAAARNLGEAWTLAGVLTSYGRALVRAGREDEALPLLAEARALWEHMGAVVWVERVDAAMPTVASSASA